MKKIGVIMEINPFHNGHKYFLKTIRKKYPDDLLVTVISSTISQRGEVSVLNKKVKTKLLLENGVDIVLELPMVYTNQGGKYFAYESVKALDLLGVDLLIFGSEKADIKYLENFNYEKETFKNGYNTKLNNLQSNDILGIGYINAIRDLNSKMNFEVIKRSGATYNSLELKGDIASATSIRENLKKGKDVSKYLEKYSLENMELISYEKLFELLMFSLIRIKNKEDIFLSENGELINKINKNIKTYKDKNLINFSLACSDKNNSKYKFMRIFINIILDVRKEDMLEIKKEKAKYNVLGFNNRASKYIKENEKHLFMSYKNKTKAYEFNEKIDKILENYYPKIINNQDNYKEPIIK